VSYCTKCGAPLKDGAGFCSACGAKVAGAQPTAHQPADAPDCNKWFGVLAYLGPALFVPMFVRKNSTFAQFHVRQGFNLLMFWIASILLRYTIGLIPYVKYLILPISIAICVFSIIGIINALRGKMIPLPLFGDKLDLLKMIFKA